MSLVTRMHYTSRLYWSVDPSTAASPGSPLQGTTSCMENWTILQSQTTWAQVSDILLHRSVRSYEVALDPDPHHSVVVRDYGLGVDQHVVEQGVGDHWLVTI